MPVLVVTEGRSPNRKITHTVNGSLLFLGEERGTNCLPSRNIVVPRVKVPVWPGAVDEDGLTQDSHLSSSIWIGEAVVVIDIHHDAERIAPLIHQNAAVAVFCVNQSVRS